MDSQQSELQFALADEGRYQVGPHAATWQRRTNDEKIVDLVFRAKRFEITREGSGPNGRPRMFINGIRTSDGKLFQGRSLLELVRKLDRHFDDFVEIPARLERIERKLDALAAGSRRVSKTKLCLVMATATWPQERYIPKAAFGGFARVPIPIIAASQCMAAGEYRLLQTVLFCAQGTGLLTAGKKRLAKLAHVAEPDVKHYLRSLCNRLILRATGRILKHGVREHELLTHPWLGENHPTGGKKDAKGGEICALRGRTVLPLKTNKTTNKTIDKKAINRPQGAARIEDDLLAKLLELCGPKEMELNGAGWLKFAREDPRSLRDAIDDLLVRRDNYHLAKVRNPAAYINRQYQFYHAKISRSDKAMARLSPDKSLSDRVRESISQAELPA